MILGGTAQVCDQSYFCSTFQQYKKMADLFALLIITIHKTKS